MVYSSSTSHLLGLCVYSVIREFTPWFYSITVSLLCAPAVKGDRFIPILESKDDFKYGPIEPVFLLTQSRIWQKFLTQSFQEMRCIHRGVCDLSI